MNTMAVDDKRLAVNAVNRFMQIIDPAGTHTGFTDAQEALEVSRDIPVDVAFLDIEMPGMNGLELAKRLKDINGAVNIVFVTGHPEYALAAHGLYVSGFLTKPIEKEGIRRALENLRHPVVYSSEIPVRIQCFGNFEIFVGKQLLFFKLNRTKELLAYLVDRKGAVCTMGELVGILWEDMPDSASQRSQLRKLIADLRAVMKEYGAEDIIIKQRNAIALDCSKVECDYYRFLQGDPTAVNLYHGEYMSQYSWPEMTVASLSDL